MAKIRQKINFLNSCLISGDVVYTDLNSNKEPEVLELSAEVSLKKLEMSNENFFAHGFTPEHRKMFKIQKNSLEYFSTEKVIQLSYTDATIREILEKAFDSEYMCSCLIIVDHVVRNLGRSSKGIPYIRFRAHCKYTNESLLHKGDKKLKSASYTTSHRKFTGIVSNFSWEKQSVFLFSDKKPVFFHGKLKEFRQTRGNLRKEFKAKLRFQSAAKMFNEQFENKDLEECSKGNSAFVFIMTLFLQQLS